MIGIVCAFFHTEGKGFYSNSSVDVDVYVFYDGSETNVYTDNLDKLTAIGATVTFTATPVNTQNQEVNAPNESK